MIDVKVVGMSELQYLKTRIDTWIKRHPQLIKGALEEGTRRVQQKVVENMRAQLTQRTGKLFAAVKQRVSVIPGTIGGYVFVDDPVQGIKARAHELGAYRRHPGGQPYVHDSRTGRIVFFRKDHPMAALLPVTKAHGIRLPKRPSFGPALKSEQKGVVHLILKRISGGFRGQR